MKKNKKLFLKEIEEKHIIYRFFGIKFSVKNPTYIDTLKSDTKEAIKIQNAYDLSLLKNAKKLILFLVPATVKINGGIMSIYSLCETSRKLNPDSVCIISTYPNSKYTYAKNDKFLNNEKIYRFFQIVDNCKNLDEIIIHIPEGSVKDFYSDLNPKSIKFVKSIKNVHLNIMNQNIMLMPTPKEIKNLAKITNNITQTIAHDRYATQEVCDKWQIPTHLFSVSIDLSRYNSCSFEEKEKIIVLSPDDCVYKSKIVEKLKSELPDFNLITVQNMTFVEYMELISKAYFTITFGEGFDGYFSQPSYVNSLGLAVYNDNFFSNPKWKSFKNVYSSYENMYENIVNDINLYLNDKNLYIETIKRYRTEIDLLYKQENFVDNLERFYKGQYDFYPLMSNK